MSEYNLKNTFIISISPCISIVIKLVGIMQSKNNEIKQEKTSAQLYGSFCLIAYKRRF